MSDVERIVRLATNPYQYDTVAVDWGKHGGISDPHRLFYWEYLEPILGDVSRRRCLDVGCGSGWLLERLRILGGVPFGVEPSRHNVEMCRALYPNTPVAMCSFEQFSCDFTFDVIIAVMTFEHLLDVSASFVHIEQLLAPDGRVFVLTFDVDYAKKDRFDYRISSYSLAPGEYAIETVRGDGTLYDLVRSPEVFYRMAEKAGLACVQDMPLCPTEEFLVACPKYKSFRDVPMFHLLQFERK